MEKKEKDVKPVTVNITNHNTFEKGVGAFITNLNHLTIVMDSEGNMKMDAVQAPVMPHTQVEVETKLSDEKLAQAIVNCQKYFWGQSSYAVLFCLLRDDYKKDMQQTAFERMIEILPYKGERDFLCPSGTIANAFSDNNIYKTHVSRWQVQGATERVMTLLNMLRKELGIINSSI